MLERLCTAGATCYTFRTILKGVNVTCLSAYIQQGKRATENFFGMGCSINNRQRSTAQCLHEPTVLVNRVCILDFCVQKHICSKPIDIVWA